MNMNFKRKLPIPMEIKEQYPLSYQLEQLKAKRDIEIKNLAKSQDLQKVKEMISARNRKED